MNSGNNPHYNSDYFAWQKQIGELGGIVNALRFRSYVNSMDRVIDFGCGGGYLLANIHCREKIGVEPNAAARAHAESKGIFCYPNCDPIKDGWADVIISNSCLEHTYNPFGELTKLRAKVRERGTLVFSVAHETLGWKYMHGDINQHLYTWSPMAIGNLFNAAGFKVVSVHVTRDAWPPNAPRVFSVLGIRLFMLVCRLYWLVRFLLNVAYPQRVDANLLVVAQKTTDAG